MFDSPHLDSSLEANYCVVMKGLIIILLILTSSQAFAQDIIQLKVTDYGWIGNFPVVKDLLDQYLLGVQRDLNAVQPVKDPERLMKGTANAVAVSSRGTGTDYTSEDGKIIMGVSLGAAADLEKNAGLKDLESGLGGAASFMFGFRQNERTSYYFDLGGLSHSKTFQSFLNTELEAEITTKHVGVHSRYWLVQGESSQNGWGGVKLHYGYEYNDNEVTISNPLNEDLNLDAGVAVIQGRLKGNPEYIIRSKIHSIPLEVSTDYKIFRFITFFGGMGLDVNWGKAKGEGDVRATLKSPLTCVSGVCTNLNLPQVEATANLNSSQSVDAFILRAFGGTQMDFGTFKAFGEVNKMLGTRVLGATVGIRAFF